MGFIYPLFLVAGIALAIPVIIHLFNLRRYKTVYFPHTRFLKNIQLRSQKSSQLRYKWLLMLRLLFLASLILAFAQPFFSSTGKQTEGSRLQAIYVDNSGSMSAKKGAQRLLDVAKELAKKQVRAAAPGTKFVLLTNDKPVSYRPMPADRVLLELGGIELSSKPKTAKQVLAVLQSITRSEAAKGVDLYYYSDFQQKPLAEVPEAALTEDMRLFAVPVRGGDVANVYIDTAYLMFPVLQIGVGNTLVVKSRLDGDKPKESVVLNLKVNGQVKSAVTADFDKTGESIDTLNFRVNDAAWQRIELTVNDLIVRFDDTFRITARSAPNLSVLCLNEGNPSPYIQAAFRAYDGFRLSNVGINNAPADWKEYSLVILNGCTSIGDKLAAQLVAAQQKGMTVCIFPGKADNIDALSESLKQLADITITDLDTATESATTVQKGSKLVKDMFELVPENIQLPTANWHYTIDAGLTANQQTVLGYRNGDPYFVQYSPYEGDLYILTTSLDLQVGNFASSYFFAPFLYQMAVQSSGGNVYALTLGNNQPAYLPLGNADERNMVHLLTGDADAIPPQRTKGKGLNVFVDEVVTDAGFYPLTAQNSDTVFVAVNQTRTESQLSMSNLGALKNNWKDVDIQILDTDDINAGNAYVDWDSFPLWKVCVILALIMLAVETLFLTANLRKPTAATE